MPCFVVRNLGYIRDGIVKIEKWRKQTIRPLFIGKEAYDLDEEGRSEWDYAEWLREKPQEAFHASPLTWPSTAQISLELQVRFAEPNSAVFAGPDTHIMKALQTIAFVNVGKYGAGKKTSWARLNSLYNQNKYILHDQIELFQPNIIIGWSTLEFFRKAIDPEQIANHDAVDSWVVDDRLYIDAYHPVQRQVSHKRYVDSIISAVQANLSNINLALLVF